jgi:magnesium-transporting ATPase (P-type)
LDTCNTLRIGDQVVPLTQEWINTIMARNDDYARQGLRVLAAAIRHFTQDLQDYQVENIETGLTFLDMVAMIGSAP